MADQGGGWIYKLRSHTRSVIWFRTLIALRIGSDTSSRPMDLNANADGTLGGNAGCIRSYVYNPGYMYLKFRGRHIWLYTSGYLLTYLLTSDYHQYTTAGISVADKVGLAVGSLFPASFWDKDILHVMHCSHVVFTTSGLSPRGNIKLPRADIFNSHPAHRLLFA